MHRLIVTICALWLALVSVAALAGGNPAQGSVRQACEDLVLDYAYYRDRRDAEPYAAIFAEDAVLSVLGVDYVGRDAIYRRLVEEKDPLTTRHMMSTIRIFDEGEGRATGVSYVTVWAAPAGEAPLLADKYLGLGEYHDEFRLTEAGWKISKRTFVPVFRSE